MNKNPCRDCGFVLEMNARGCPRCAMNVEAERKIERFIRWVSFSAVVIILAGVGVIYFTLR